MMISHRGEDAISIDMYYNDPGYIFTYDWRSIDHWDRSEFLKEIRTWKDEDIRCKCGRSLDYPYLYIIHNLKKAGLLPRSYDMMCCFCHILACVGFEIPEEWVYVRFLTHYGGMEEILGYSAMQINALYLPTKERFSLIVRIHDTKKFLDTGRMIEDIKIKEEIIRSIRLL